MAFIKTAWRRYTKHSRNKVQEIQGAIEPLAQTYSQSLPFKGAILAGVFTAGALTQLKSLGFKVVYFPYDSIITAFKKSGIDARFDEKTPDAEFALKVEAFHDLSDRKRTGIWRALLKLHESDISKFLDSLSRTVARRIDRIVILAFQGRDHIALTVGEAIDFINSFHHEQAANSIDRYEIEIRYNNGDQIRGKFGDKASAITFLQGYEPNTK